MARIITVNTLLPEFTYTEQEAIDVYTKWVLSQDESFRKKLTGFSMVSK